MKNTLTQWAKSVLDRTISLNFIRLTQVSSEVREKRLFFSAITKGFSPERKQSAMLFEKATHPPQQNPGYRKIILALQPKRLGTHFERLRK